MAMMRYDGDGLCDGMERWEGSKAGTLVVRAEFGVGQSERSLRASCQCTWYSTI